MEPITVTCCHCNRTQKVSELKGDKDAFLCTMCAQLCILCKKNTKVGSVPGSVDVDPDICYQCTLDLDSDSEFNEDDNDDRSVVQMSHGSECLDTAAR
jgi:hypothetical protein